MNLSPFLWFETVIIGLLAIGVLWARPEYGLFLYGLALGFPDLALSLSGTINIRADDVLLLLLAPRILLWRPAPASPGQKKILSSQILFLFVCLFSAAVESLRGDPPGAYETAKMLGCAAILLCLPPLVQTERRVLFLISGLVCGGLALVAQFFFRLGTGSANSVATIQELKSAVTFSTWNPNTIGQAAVLLAFAAGIRALLFSDSPGKKFVWLCTAIGFALVPAFMFVRGTSVSLAAGFLLFFSLVRRWKLALLFLLVCLAFLAYLRSSDRRLAEQATQVNFETGEGLSHRFERWDLAFQGIQSRPFLGHGFGQELNSLGNIGSEGRAHNAYLTVWLELGLGGLLLFLAAISQYFRAAYSLYKIPRFRLAGAMILAVMTTLGIDSLGLPTLYWEKLPTITLSLGLILIGLSERKVLQVVESRNPGFVCEPMSQIL